MRSNNWQAEERIVAEFWRQQAELRARLTTEFEQLCAEMRIKAALAAPVFAVELKLGSLVRRNYDKATDQ